jgi:AcrR family transcriptional regulator
MARDASDTRERLVAEARRLFAEEGVYRVKVADIVAAARQRNPSALTYHFGSRGGVLREILDRHNGPIDDDRGRYLAALGPAPSTRDLVTALLRPYSTQFDTREGREYLRIVAQLGTEVTDVDFDVGAVAGANLQRVFVVLLERPGTLPLGLRRDRLLAAVILMTASMAERARHIDAGEAVDPSDELFLSNLADMLVAVLDAPAGPALRALPRDAATGRRLNPAS